MITSQQIKGAILLIQDLLLFLGLCFIFVWIFTYNLNLLFKSQVFDMTQGLALLFIVWALRSVSGMKYENRKYKESNPPEGEQGSEESAPVGGSSS